MTTDQSERTPYIRGEERLALVEDLALRGKMIISRNFRSFETYIVVTAMYVVMTLTISVALKLLGRRVFRQAA